MERPFRLAIFCSGGGSNAAKIMEYFKDHGKVQIVLLVANKHQIGALAHAANHDIPAYVTSRAEFYSNDSILSILAHYQVTHIILAGWLWLVPPSLLSAYTDKVVNIHPALLPKYGGKGMHGHHVHEAVKQAGETVSGPTIHLANEEFDKGKILFQAEVKISPDDTPQSIAAKVLSLEHAFYAPAIEAWLTNLPMPKTS